MAIQQQKEKIKSLFKQKNIKWDKGVYLTNINFCIDMKIWAGDIKILDDSLLYG